MARLEANAKMGYYPTPAKSLSYIRRWIENEDHEKYRVHGNPDMERKFHYLDPCCGDGSALREVAGWDSITWGIELDAERAVRASEFLDNVIQCSIFDARVNPLESMGLLWLNPPYDLVEGERVEMKFLKHSIKWLCPGGVLAFMVPENIMNDRNREWIGQHFQETRVMRLHREDYPQFRQVVLFGKKRTERVEDGEVIPPPPYSYIEESEIKEYLIPPTEGPGVFQGTDSVTGEDIEKNYPRLLEELKRIAGYEEEVKMISPLLPLRKGHLVALITAGILNGTIHNLDGSFIVVKGFSDRVRDTRIEENKEIIRDTYAVGIRVIEQGGKWYDIR